MSDHNTLKPNPLDTQSQILVLRTQIRFLSTKVTLLEQRLAAVEQLQRGKT